MVDQGNIPNLRGHPLPSWSAHGREEFLGTYDGVVRANHAERTFLKMVLAGRPGLILADVIAGSKFTNVPFLGTAYPVGHFPFNLALRQDLSVAFIWWEKIRGRGYALKVREVSFRTVEEGALLFGSFMEEVIRANPYIWHYSPEWQNRLGMSER